MPESRMTSAGKRKRDAKSTMQRNQKLDLPWVEVPDVKLGDSRLCAGKNVELLPSAKVLKKHEIRPEFLAIHHIMQNLETDEVRLYGHAMYTAYKLGLFDTKLNEIHLLVDQDADDSRPLYEQGMIYTDLKEVAIIRKVVFTHQDFPALNFRKDVYISRKMGDEAYRARRRMIKDTCLLVCRHVLIRCYETGEARLKGSRYCQWTARRLKEGEHPTKATNMKLKRNLPKVATIDTARSKLRQGVSTTYGTGFCGGSGDAFGAASQDMDVRIAWDKCPKCCRVFQLNFPRAKVFNKEAFDMIQLMGEDLYCDIWHLSCPCQTYSAAHTRPGKNDGSNSSATFTVKEFLKKTRPIMVTLEQTEGIENRHPAFHAALINQVITSGFDVTWKITEFSEYGLASKRLRLVCLGSRQVLLYNEDSVFALT